MLTGSELVKDLEEVKKKAEFIEITYVNNPLWKEVNSRLKELISLVKTDMKIFGYV